MVKIFHESSVSNDNLHPQKHLFSCESAETWNDFLHSTGGYSVIRYVHIHVH